MRHSGNQPKFEIRPVIEQTPFESLAVRSFFAKWCEINDSIQQQVISRKDWEQRGAKGILEKKSGGNHTLYIPEDLHLWEMVGVMEAVDHDTFTAKPERQDEAKRKLLELGKTFQNAGIYIAQRLDSIKDGREIASALAEEFYHYGQSLAGGAKPEKVKNIDAIASYVLSPQEVKAIDRFLAGDSLSQSRLARAKKAIAANPDKREEFYEYETERQKTLAQFFRSAAKAFALKKKSERGKLRKNKTHLQPWQSDTPLHTAFLAKIEKAMIRKIETPRRELGASIFRRGMELLQKNMPFDSLPVNVKNSILYWQNGEKTLREALQIDTLKTELEAIKHTGNTAKISAKEIEIADKIQMAVSGFLYKGDANNPSEMVASQYINCVGASTLGGALMQEAGLNYLVGDMPRHSILFLVTRDGSVLWRDMLNPLSNEDLTDDVIEGRKKDGSPITVADIATFSKNQTPEGLMFDVKSETYKAKFPLAKEGQRQYVTVFEPEYGQQIQILYNTGCLLFNLGRYEEAAEAYRQAIALVPNVANFYCNIGSTFYNLYHYEEAAEAYRQAIAIDPKFALSYYSLGGALYELGYHEETIKAYRKFLDLADKKQDFFYIKYAKQMIAKLK